MNSPLLLTDKQLQQFLIDGYLVLQPMSLDDNFHSSIYAEISSIFARGGNPGNNLLPKLPQLQQVFNDPLVHGALISLLGANYTMQPHRHPHLTKPNTRDQQWHKDSYFGYQKPLRHHQLRYVMAMYYPQHTTLETGPTAIKPQTQYLVKHHEASENNPQNDVRMVCSAGTVVLIHYDIVHKGTANQTAHTNRFMFKFQFNRLDEPTKPTWNHDPSNASYDAADAGLLQPIVKHIWNWLLGGTNTPSASRTDQQTSKWETKLHDKDGMVRLNAAYNLALNNQYRTLIKQLHHHEAIVRYEAAYALTACRFSKDAIKELQIMLDKEAQNENQALCVAFIFSEMGSVALEAIPMLIHVMKTSQSQLVKLYCCEALGNIQSNEEYDHHSVVRCLIEMVSNRSEEEDSKDASHVRFTAALSLAKLGSKANEATNALKNALHFDPNRYVNGNALLALERIGSNEALKIVLDYLKISRWCSKTTTDSLY
ncbi:unnamed protein product [Adineta ricciae]|uniref:Phytanoyl-CoA dioxygenase n=1 Tax=Adineta ricciae TaxID=249248 RepID=A0A814SM70_ADIRI|nr:unnamed protein product [Adineta ricciae]CAF1429480.1 unnamed protein product [Adineta ricciae]